MEDSRFELEIPVGKRESEINVDNQTNTDNSYSVIDIPSRSDSKTDSNENVKEIKEINKEVQKYGSLESPEEIQTNDGLISIVIGMKNLSLETKADDNNRTVDDEKREDTTSNSTKFPTFVDVHQRNLFKNQEYDSSVSSSRKDEINNLTPKLFESSDFDANEIEDIGEVNLIDVPSSVKVKSPNSSTNEDKDLIKVNEECFGENYKQESAFPNSEHMKTTLGSLESTAEEGDTYFTEFVRKVIPKILLMSASEEVESDSEDKCQKCPKEMSENTTMLESPGSEAGESNLSKSTEAENDKEVTEAVCSGQKYENKSATINSEFQVKDIHLFGEELRKFIKSVKKVKQKFRDSFVLKHRFGSEDKCQNVPQEMSANTNVAGSKDSKIAESNLSHITTNRTADDAKGEEIFDAEDRHYIRKIIFLLEDIDNDRSEKELESVLIEFYRRVPHIIRRARACKAAEMNSKGAKSEKKQTLEQNSPKKKSQNALQYIEVIKHEVLYAHRRTMVTENQIREASSGCHGTANKDYEKHKPQQQELHGLLRDDNQTSSPKEWVGGSCGNTILLSGEILLENTCRDQPGIVNGASSKFHDIPTQIVAPKDEVKDNLIESKCKGGENPSEVILKSGTRAAIIGQPVIANEASLLESNPCDTDVTYITIGENAYTEGIHIRLDVSGIVGMRVEETFMSEEFIKLVEKLTVDSEYTQEKCMEFLGHLHKILHKNTHINAEKLFKRETKVIELINIKLIDTRAALDKFMERIDGLLYGNIIIHPDLKNRMRDSATFMNRIISCPCPYFETILEKLHVIDEGIVIKGSKQNRFKRVIAGVMEQIECMKKQTILIQNKINHLNVIG